MTQKAPTQEVANDIIDIMVTGYDANLDQGTIQSALRAYSSIARVERYEGQVEAIVPYPRDRQG